MTKDPINPYQPPVEEANESSPTNTWSVSGKYLLVRPGALLPPVALDGHGTILTPVMWKFSVLAGKFLVWGFAPVEALRTRSRQHQMARILVRLGLCGLLATLLAMTLTLSGFPGSVRLGAHPGDILWWLVPAVGISILLLISAAGCSGHKPGLRCVLFKGGWLYLKGIPPESLALLAVKSREPIPAARTRKVYTTYLHQLPLGSLLGNSKWNPWSAIRFALMKARRSPLLETLSFHVSERLTLPLSAADRDLLALWKKETSGSPLAEWTLVLANRLDAPQGYMRVEYVFYASPDWRHFASLTVRRIAVGDAFSESHNSILRAWGEDGGSFFTSTFQPQHEIPGNHNWAVVKGPLPLIWETHAQRLEATPVRAARDLEEFVGWMEADAAESDMVEESLGLQSPVREMEVGDFPK